MYIQSKKISVSSKVFLIVLIAFFSLKSPAQGIWTPLTNLAPDYNSGVMLLLSDGTVMAKTSTGGTDGVGNTWDKLTPDTNGSYINGTWTTLAPMYDTRLYFASQVLKDGRVFVAGGEYGTGGSLAETYDPLTDVWTPAPAQGTYFGDANSEILPDGKVLVALLDTSDYNFDTTIIFNPKTNTWTGGPNSIGDHDESAWVKLPDNSILFVDLYSFNSERYIPSLGHWVSDGTVPVQLYDSSSYESGAGFLLPNGHAFFLGSTGHTAYYAPSGNNNPGTWTVGPDIPNGYGTPDAAAAMMVNGKILCAVSPAPTTTLNTYASPTAYYEFDYTNNSFLQITAPDGSIGDTISGPCYVTNMLCLPDGTILYCDQDNDQYYIYTPGGTPLASGKPTINNVAQIGCDTFRVAGKLFNGISEGAAYGDDWQMATNYPIVRLSSGPYIYYARSFNWNRTGVQTGNLADTTLFTPPAGLQAGTYSLVVTANGISSNPTSFVYTPCATSIKEKELVNNISVFPNPANEFTSVVFKTKTAGNYTIKMLDVFGRTIKEEIGQSLVGENSHSLSLTGIAKGIYVIAFQKGDSIIKTKIIIN